MFVESFSLMQQFKSQIKIKKFLDFHKGKICSFYIFGISFEHPDLET